MAGFREVIERTGCSHFFGGKQIGYCRERGVKKVDLRIC